MAGEREELASIVADLRGHLEWLRDNGERVIPVAARAPVAAQGAPAASAGPASPGAEPVRGRSLRDSVRAAVGQPSRTQPPPVPPTPAPVASAPAPAARVAVPPAPPRAPMAGAAAPIAGGAAAPMAGAVAPMAGAAAPMAGAAAPTGRRSLEEIRAELGDCRRCRLAAGRTRLVFGEGSPTAELVFVGDAPAPEDDQSGTPFSGEAGKLLTRMIEAMGLSRERVYITTLVRCRPPEGRAAGLDEVAACEPFLKAQLASLRPKVIVALGKFVAQTLLREDTAISELRGTWREYCGVRLMPTFHPAYLLQKPGEKKKVWDDLKRVMAELGL